MIITNWQRIENGIDSVEGAGVYLMYDGRGKCLYIGQSAWVSDRLLTHLYGEGRSESSPVGRFILRHRPQSSAWPIFIVESKDSHAVRVANYIRLAGRDGVERLE
jgi:hypothetical protein